LRLRNSIMNILITGGAGFIGSHLIKHMVNRYPNYTIINVDALTYAADKGRLQQIEAAENYHFEEVDVSDPKEVQGVFSSYQVDAVIHLAAESHVDRSIENPLAFAETNILGTMQLLEACRSSWKKGSDHLFYHVSTDEVYGSLDKKGVFDLKSAYNPRSPYAASKASADHMVRAYGATYGLPYIISNCSNNYGPDQHEEKLIPTLLTHLNQNKSLPIYGDGSNVRDWLYVEDHVEAMDLIFHKGTPSETYLIGGRCEKSNLAVAQDICTAFDVYKKQPKGTAEKLITFVNDRPGHDFRYAINPEKLEQQLGWSANTPWQQGLNQTVHAFMDNI
jgi:dTDP-glucose 4,6-dehydratase